MQREIKFRAINGDGEIIYGLPYTDGVNETVYYKDFNNRLCWRNEKGAHCNQPYKNGTLMQYTGLKDKNGVEIYEGDIVHKDEGVWEVKIGGYFTKHDVGWGVHYASRNPAEYAIEATPLGQEGQLEVIGNIYENKGLLDKRNLPLEHT